MSDMKTATTSTELSKPAVGMLPAKPVREIAIDKLKQSVDKLELVMPTATTYMPVFCDDVFIVGQGTSTPVNELYCLSLPSAVQLAIILANICVAGFLAQPCDLAYGSPFVYSRDVPWLRFDNGAERNAGQLAQYWKANNGDPGGKTAEAWAREDIAWG